MEQEGQPIEWQPHKMTPTDIVRATNNWRATEITPLPTPEEEIHIEELLIEEGWRHLDDIIDLLRDKEFLTTHAGEYISFVRIYILEGEEIFYQITSQTPQLPRKLESQATIFRMYQVGAKEPKLISMENRGGVWTQIMSEAEAMRALSFTGKVSQDTAFDTTNISHTLANEKTTAHDRSKIPDDTKEVEEVDAAA